MVAIHTQKAELERLPPYQMHCKKAILWAHYQTIICINGTVPISEDHLHRTMAVTWMTMHRSSDDQGTACTNRSKPAEQLVKCGCSKSKCDNVRSSCRKAGLNCKQLCALELGEVCDNPERAISSLNDVEGEDPGDDEDDVENFI